MTICALIRIVTCQCLAMTCFPWRAQVHDKHKGAARCTYPLAHKRVARFWITSHSSHFSNVVRVNLLLLIAHHSTQPVNQQTSTKPPGTPWWTTVSLLCIYISYSYYKFILPKLTKHHTCIHQSFIHAWEWLIFLPNLSHAVYAHLRIHYSTFQLTFILLDPHAFHFNPNLLWW